MSNYFKYFTVEGTDNVLDLKKYRSFKECHKLFAGYKNRLSKMHKIEAEAEAERIRKEMAQYPHHLLTGVKVQIFENTTGIKL